MRLASVIAALFASSAPGEEFAPPAGGVTSEVSQLVVGASFIPSPSIELRLYL